MRSFVLDFNYYDFTNGNEYRYVFTEDSSICQINGSWTGSTGKYVQTVSLEDSNGELIWSSFYWGSAFSWSFNEPLDIPKGSQFIMDAPAHSQDFQFLVCVGML